MFRFILKRTAAVLPVLLGVSFIIFTLMFFSPGDAADRILGDMATESDKQLFREQNGLDSPFFVQYFRYVGNIVLRGDFGTSYTTKQPVMNEIFARFPVTLRLAGISILIATVCGLLFGILAAVYRNTIFDSACTFFSVLGVSMPNFWQGMMMIILFSVVLKWLPPSGISTSLHWIMPAVTLSTGAAGSIMRMTRSSMLEVLHQDYTRTAYAKGLRKLSVVVVHVLKNALIPIVTVIGIAFGRLMGGAVMTESVFSIPGLGKLMVDSIRDGNTPMVQGIVLYLASVLVVLNMVIDILYSVIDPRIRPLLETKRRRVPGETVKPAAAGGGAS